MRSSSASALHNYIISQWSSSLVLVHVSVDHLSPKQLIKLSFYSTLIASQCQPLPVALLLLLPLEPVVVPTTHKGAWAGGQAGSATEPWREIVQKAISTITFPGRVLLLLLL